MRRNATSTSLLVCVYLVLSVIGTFQLASFYAINHSDINVKLQSNYIKYKLEGNVNVVLCGICHFTSRC